MRYLLLTLALFVAVEARAVPGFDQEVCGNGIDDDSSGGDASCTGISDTDRDGWADANDANDSNRYDYPGIWVAHDGSNVKQNLSTGSYSSNVANASYTRKSGSGADYFVSSSGSTSGGCGAYASECDWRCFSDSSLACYHAPIAGDAIIFKSGTYSSTWSDSGTTRQFYLNAKSGTQTNPIYIGCFPGATCTIQGAGTNPTEVFPIHTVNSSDLIIEGFNIDGSSGYNNSGIYLNGGNRIFVRNNTIHNIDGNGASNNVACVKASGGQTDIYIEHNLLYDCYQVASPTDGNNAMVTIFETLRYHVNYNVIYSTRSGGAAYAIKDKRTTLGNTGSDIVGNIVGNTYLAGITWCSANTLITNNYLEDTNEGRAAGAARGGAFAYIETGGTSEYSGSVVRYNTVNRAPFLESTVCDNYTSITAPWLTADHNVVVDDDSSYSADGTDGFIRINHYAKDTAYDVSDSTSEMNFNNNCYYNASASPFYDFFASTSSSGNCSPGTATSGAGYSTLAGWQGAFTNNEASTVEANPTLAADTQTPTTNATCQAAGWATSWGSTSSTTTTTTTTSTTTTVAAYKEGFNLRDTLAYCTDPTDTQILCYTSGVGCDSPYPTTAAGATFGATTNSGDNKRDRSAAIDCRLAGVSFQENNAAAPNIVRVDLPQTGNYLFRMAMGQGGGFTAGANQKAVLKDNTNVLATITDASVAADHWVDATGVERTSASDWVTNNAPLTVTFTTTTAFLEWGYGDGSTSGNTFMSHFSFELSTTTTTTTLPARVQYQKKKKKM